MTRTRQSTSHATPQSRSPNSSTNGSPKALSPDLSIAKLPSQEPENPYSTNTLGHRLFKHSVDSGPAQEGVASRSATTLNTRWEFFYAPASTTPPRKPLPRRRQASPRHRRCIARKARGRLPPPPPTTRGTTRSIPPTPAGRRSFAAPDFARSTKKREQQPVETTRRETNRQSNRAWARGGSSHKDYTPQDTEDQGRSGTASQQGCDHHAEPEGQRDFQHQNRHGRILTSSALRRKGGNPLSPEGAVGCLPTTSGRLRGARRRRLRFDRWFSRDGPR